MSKSFSFTALLFCLLLIFISDLHSQGRDEKIDSLKTELSLHIEKDTVRVNLLNELAFSSFSKDLTASIAYLDEADEIADAIHFEKGRARSIYIRGITEAIQSNFDQALSFYNEALSWYESIGFMPGIAGCYNAMGIAHKNTGELRKSVHYFTEAIKMEEEIGGKNLSAPLINLGSVYQDLGEFDEAILYLKKALANAEADENEQRVAYSLNNLGTVYYMQGNYPLALEHYKQSMYMNEKLGDSLGIINNLYNMGQIYQTQKNRNKALDYYKQSLEINERINRKTGIATLLNSIGTIHEENGDYTVALSHYADALRISEEIGAGSNIPFIQSNIGAVYLALKEYSTAIRYFTEAKKNGLENDSKQAICTAHLGLAKTYVNQKKYTSALSSALEAQKISQESGFLEDQKEASEILFKIYQAIGNYKEALKNHQLYKSLNDSLFNKENIEKIAQLEYEYQYKQALDSASIRELKLTQTVMTTSQDLAESRQNFLWAVIGILIVSILLGAVAFYQKYNNIKARTENIITEQKLLRSQMTPHFVFNSLSVLQGMILNKEEKKSVSYLAKFSRLLRLTLENSRDQMVVLSQELAAVENYLSLQSFEDETYHYTITIDDGIDTDQFNIPPMLIQPFIENAIEHAFGAGEDEQQIDVELSYSNEELVCTIKDNGIGINAMKENTGGNKKSLATSITSERLNILSTNYKMKGSVAIDDRSKYNEKGTIVTLVIPYEKLEVA